MAGSAPDEAMERPKNILRLSIFQPHTIATASQQRYLHFMFVCICNAIKEEELREVARHGVTDPEAAYAVLGKAPQCRVCSCRSLGHVEGLRANFPDVIDPHQSGRVAPLGR